LYAILLIAWVLTVLNPELFNLAGTREPVNQGEDEGINR
jgi:hypothetical protein